MLSQLRWLCTSDLAVDAAPRIWPAGCPQMLCGGLVLFHSTIGTFKQGVHSVSAGILHKRHAQHRQGGHRAAAGSSQVMCWRSQYE